MFQPPIGIGPEGELLEGPSRVRRSTGRRDWSSTAPQPLQHLRDPGRPAAGRVAQQVCRRLAETTRLGIPVTISSDPRHSFDENAVVGWSTGSFSQWPEPIGLAATRDEELVRGFGEIARQEYRAVGIHVALHPMADVATEPRWARIGGTFGEDFELAGRLTAGLRPGLPGRRARTDQRRLHDQALPRRRPAGRRRGPHFPYGKDQVYPGGRFEDHLRPFESAFAAGTAQVMPYYGRPVGRRSSSRSGSASTAGDHRPAPRAASASTASCCTDWDLVSDLPMPDGSVWEAKAWGVEDLDPQIASARIIEAGCDQLGGEHCRSSSCSSSSRAACPKRASTSRRGGSCATSSASGSSTTPTSIPRRRRRICGRADFRAAGDEAQRRAIVLLSNNGLLPLRSGARLFVDGLPEEAAAAYGSVVEHPADADAAIVFRHAPYEPREGTFIESLFHAGSLEFPTAERDHILDIARAVPTILVVHLDRPAILTELAGACNAVVGTFGASPDRDPRPRLRCVLTDRQAPVRASLVDGCGPPSALRRARATPSSRCSSSGTVSPTSSQPSSTTLRPMQVGISLLTFVPGELGGSETYVRELLRNLARDGQHSYRVLLPSLAPELGAGPPVGGRAGVPGGTDDSAALARDERGSRACPAVCARASRRPTSCTTRSPAPARPSRARRSPRCSTCSTSTCRRCSPRAERALPGGRLGTLVRSSDRVIVISEFVRDRAVASSGSTPS